jgi:hypothetical protein
VVLTANGGAEIRQMCLNQAEQVGVFKVFKVRERGPARTLKPGQPFLPLPLGGSTPAGSTAYSLVTSGQRRLWHCFSPLALCHCFLYILIPANWPEDSSPTGRGISCVRFCTHDSLPAGLRSPICCFCDPDRPTVSLGQRIAQPAPSFREQRQRDVARLKRALFACNW